MTPEDKRQVEEIRARLNNRTNRGLSDPAGTFDTIDVLRILDQEVMVAESQVAVERDHGEYRRMLDRQAQALEDQVTALVSLTGLAGRIAESLESFGEIATRVLLQTGNISRVLEAQATSLETLDGHAGRIAESLESVQRLMFAIDSRRSG